MTHPEERTLTALSGLDEATCWTVIQSSNVHLKQLNRWVKQGNWWAALYLTEHLKRLDGGYLEDALVAMGQFSDHDMERLLILANKKMLSKWELKQAAMMFPLPLSDDAQAQLEFLTRRRNRVLRVRRKDLLQQRSEALAAIDYAIAEIRSKNPGIR